jgi:hypothetical protein
MPINLFPGQLTPERLGDVRIEAAVALCADLPDGEPKAANPGRKSIAHPTGLDPPVARRLDDGPFADGDELVPERVPARRPGDLDLPPGERDGEGDLAGPQVLEEGDGNGVTPRDLSRERSSPSPPTKPSGA